MVHHEKSQPNMTIAHQMLSLGSISRSMRRQQPKCLVIWYEWSSKSSVIYIYQFRVNQKRGKGRHTISCDGAIVGIILQKKLHEKKGFSHLIVDYTSIELYSCMNKY